MTMDKASKKEKANELSLESAAVSTEEYLAYRNDRAKQQAQQLYQRVATNKEYAENNYYQLPIQQQRRCARCLYATVMVAGI